MKKSFFILFLFIEYMIFIPKVYAICEDAELNNWASSIQIEKLDYSVTGFTDEQGNHVWTGGLEIAYMLAPSKARKDIYLTATNNLDDDIQESRYIPGYDIIAIGTYSNIVEIKYTVNVYGSEDSACPNELLKTQRITIPPLNKYVTSEFCDKYPEHENCTQYKDTTGITQEEFIEEAKKYEKEHKDDKINSIKDIIISGLKEYSLFVLVPLLSVSIYFIIVINKYKREERDK